MERLYCSTRLSLRVRLVAEPPPCGNAIPNLTSVCLHTRAERRDLRAAGLPSHILMAFAIFVRESSAATNGDDNIFRS